MSKGFIVTIDDQEVYTTKSIRSPGRLRRHFDEITHKMDEGITLGSQTVAKPNDYQKQQYVALLLVNGLQADDVNLVHVMAAYLYERYPQLREIRVNSQGEQFNLKLINN